MTASPGLRERKKLRTRRAIQRTALELFAAQGYRETTLAQIAAAADVSLRTVTVYFPAKEDLILSLGSDGLDALIERIESRPAGQQTLDTLAAWIIEQITESAVSQPSGEGRELLRLRHQATASDPELKARIRVADVRIEQTLAAGIAQDIGLPAEALAPRLAAATVMAGLRTITEPGDENQSFTSRNNVYGQLDDTLDFARAGLAALGTSESPAAS